MVRLPWLEGTSQVNSSAAVSRVKVSADGHGVVSHAGVGMVREVADLTGLCGLVTAALADAYRGPWTHAPGDVFADLAAAVADGADCVDGVGQLWGDREHAFGPVGSTTTLWRWSMSASMPPGCRGLRRRERTPGSGPGRRGLPRPARAGCTSMSMPPSPSTIPTTRRMRPRPGSTPSAFTRC